VLLENRLECKIKSKVKALGGKCYKWVSPGNDGVPDRIVVLPGGRVIFLEVKRPGRKNGLSPIQTKRINELVKLGCKAYCVASMAEFEEVVSK
jgi:hypothetical protein